ncbi:hypothetical protein P7K49_025459, partial [Saguinus oedipus]
LDRREGGAAQAAWRPTSIWFASGSEEPPCPRPGPPRPSPPRPSPPQPPLSVSAPAPLPAAQPPPLRPSPPRPAAARVRLRARPARARPACPFSPPSCSGLVGPLLLRPVVLTFSPSFPQRMSGFQINLNPLKEPLGFIKVLEWVSVARAGQASCGFARRLGGETGLRAGTQPCSAAFKAGGQGGCGLGPRGAETPRQASNHEFLDRLAPRGANLPRRSSPLGAPNPGGRRRSLRRGSAAASLP